MQCDTAEATIKFASATSSCCYYIGRLSEVSMQSTLQSRQTSPERILLECDNKSAVEGGMFIFDYEYIMCYILYI